MYQIQGLLLCCKFTWSKSCCCCNNIYHTIPSPILQNLLAHLQQIVPISNAQNSSYYVTIGGLAKYHTNNKQLHSLMCSLQVLTTKFNLKKPRTSANFLLSLCIMPSDSKPKKNPLKFNAFTLKNNNQFI